MANVNFRKFVLLSIALLGFVLFFSSSTAAQTKDDTGAGSSALAGTWKMESESPSGDAVAWTLTLTQKEGGWSATVGEPQGQSRPASNLRVTGNKVHFQTMYESDPYDIDLTLQGGTLTGTWSGNGQSGKTTGKRAQ